MSFSGLIIDRQGKVRKLSDRSRLREGEVQIEFCDDKSLLISFHKNEECSSKRKRKIVRFPLNGKQLNQLKKIFPK